jgi:hypothetical protein
VEIFIGTFVAIFVVICFHHACVKLGKWLREDNLPKPDYKEGFAGQKAQFDNRPMSIGQVTLVVVVFIVILKLVAC